MHKCLKCGTEFDGKFCPGCGSEWEEFKICPKCGAKLLVTAQFCTECGHPLGADTGGGDAGDMPNAAVPTDALPETDMPVQRQMSVLKDIKKVTARATMMKVLPICLIMPIASLVVIIFSIVLGFTANTEKWSPRELNNIRRNFKIYSIVYGILSLAIIIVIIVGMYTFIPLVYISSSVGGISLCAILGFYACLFLFGAILSVSMLPVLGKLNVVFFGSRNAVTTYDSILVDVGTLHKTRSYVASGLIAGKKPGPDVLTVLYPVLAIALAAVIAFICMFSLAGCLFNSTKYVEKIRIGHWKDENGIDSCSNYEVQQFLGKPDNISDVYNDLDRYEYYSQNYKNLNKRAQKLEKELLNATSDSKIKNILNELDEIFVKASTMEFKVIFVSFSNGIASEVVLMQSAQYDMSFGVQPVKSDYRVNKVEVAKSVSNDSSDFILTAKVWFTDGSYHNSFISPSITPNISDGYTLKWYDSIFDTEIKTDVSKAFISEIYESYYGGETILSLVG